MITRSALSAAFLASCAGAALAQPVIDGSLGSDGYGPILWVQSQPTTFGDNVAGTGGTIGDPASVTTGVELAIPLSLLGNPASIRLAGFVNGGGHDYVSNQVIGGLPVNTGNLAEPRNLNFGGISGNQFVDLSPNLVTTAPMVNGTRDESIYGAPKFIQNNYTGFGDNNNPAPDSANGSEIDAVYAVVYDNATPADTTDDVLYLFIAGVLETNFNKLELFFDTGVPGQNNLRSDNSGVDSDGLNRMGNDSGTNGLTFDPGFEASHWVGMTNGGTPTGVYVNFAQLLPGAGGGPGFYCGTTAPASDGTLSGGDVGAPVLLATIDNSATNGVGGSPTGITIPNVDVANGSELDGLYATVSGGKLYVLITGNLQTNFNKLDLFFDVNATEGQNTLRADNVDIDYNGLNRMGTGGGGDAGRPGLTFDAGFTADYFIGITNGSFPVENYTNAAVLRANGPIYNSGYIMDYSATHGGPKSTTNPMDFPATYADQQDFISTDPLNTDCAPRQAMTGTLIPGLLRSSINNSNVGGVSGTDSPDVSGAASVTTGIELELDLAELGWDGGAIRIAGFLNGTGHDFVSNQVLGGLPTPSAEPFAPSLGEAAVINFAQIAGDQFVTVPIGPVCGTADFDGDGDTGTDADIEAFFACLAGNCCGTCFALGADFNADGDVGTDADIESFFRVLAGGAC